MKVRNGIEIAEFRTNAKLNFCHPVEKENISTQSVRESYFFCDRSLNKLLVFREEATSVLNSFSCWSPILVKLE